MVIKMNKRQVYYDVLKIIACFAIVLIHVSVESWSSPTIDNYWLTNNFINSMVKCWSVPTFVVISGSLLLNKKDLDYKIILKKYIPRIIICLVTWHFVYYFYSIRDFSIKGILNEVKNLLTGYTYSHLWYLYLLIGLYIVTPLLSKMLKNLNNKELKQLLFIGFFITSFIPTIELLTNVNLIKYIEPYRVLSFSYFIFYYILGYYLSKETIPKPKLILFISTILLIGISILANIVSIKTGTATTYSETYNIIGILIVSSLFTIIKEKYKDKKNKAINEIGKLTFGIYLIHLLIEKILYNYGINANIMNPIFGNIIISLLIFLISYIIVFFLSRIPIIKKIVL